MTDRKLETPADVFAAAGDVYYNDDLEADDVDEELDTLVAVARTSSMGVTKADVLDCIEEREDADKDAVSYSWVHLSVFGLFELHGQCLPWATTDELRSVVDEIP